MSINIISGDCRDVLKTLASESVHCVVTGRIQKGKHLSPATEFKSGQHWRKPKSHWSKAWLETQYIANGRSAAEIAIEMGCTENNILFWLHKHDIPRRSTREVRAAKYWGASGRANPMYGRTDALNPRYVDGSAPERQRMYVRAEGRSFLSRIYRRDGFKCVRCLAAKSGPRSLHVHHIKPWAGNNALRFDETNVVALCRACHHWVHSKANVSREYLA